MPAHSRIARPWNRLEEAALLDFLIECLSEGGDGTNFKKPTFQKATGAIAPFRSKGPAKDYSSCQNKWGALKKTGKIVNAIRNLSGVKWDDEKGANIGPDEADMWDDYAAKNPGAKPFRNSGWPHLAKMDLLLPSSTSTTTVFHPLASQSTPADVEESDSETPPAAAAPSPEDSGNESDIETPAASGPVIPRKRSRNPPAAPATPAAPRKRVRTSVGASALTAMVAAMDRFTDRMAESLAAPPNGVDATPRRRTNAITAARKLEVWLSRPQLMALIKIFQSDKAACDVYLGFLKDDELRVDWVAQQINLPSTLTPVS